MTPRQTPLALAISAMVLTSAPMARADGDDLLGGLIGGIIAGAIVSEVNRKPSRSAKPATTSRKSAVSAGTPANREVQTALNYFGFDAGTPDGVLGRRSVAAISEFQAMLGYPPTGQMTEYERSLLVDSYHRAVAGGATTQQQIAANPLGPRGLLLEFRDQRAAAMAMVPAASGAPAPATLVGNTAGEAGLPSFFGGDTVQASLASHCNKIGLMTSSNGGFVTAGTMGDPRLALSEQFCLARTYAIATGEEMEAKINGFTPQQIADQCAGFGPALKDIITAVSVKPRDDVIKDAASFALSTGMSPAQLAGTAKICLSVGYRTDSMSVALASALLLTALGERPYAELLGHHLIYGFGTSQRSDLALAWYDLGLEALDTGQTAAFAPGQPERTALLRQAAYAANGTPLEPETDVVKASAVARESAQTAEAPAPAGFILFTSPTD